jgi:hypothetical protein
MKKKSKIYKNIYILLAQRRRASSEEARDKTNKLGVQ